MSIIASPAKRRYRRHAAALAGATVLIGALGVTSAATAAPPVPFELAPASLNFGSVPLGGSSTKPVRMINRTKEWLSYGGGEANPNYWPNFANPNSWINPSTDSTWPYGVWNVSGSGPNFPCYEIPPKGSCALDFRFTPKVVGLWETHFDVHYTGETSGVVYGSITNMRGTGIAAPPVP